MSQFPDTQNKRVNDLNDVCNHGRAQSAWIDNTVETILRYSMDVRESCARLQQTRVLIVVNLVGEPLTMLDVYKAVAEGSDLAKDLSMRVAYVDANEEHAIDTMILAEDMAATRGIPVRTFRNVQDAETWLVGQSHD